MLRSRAALIAATQGGGVGTDTDAGLWAAQVVTNGGTVSATRLALVSATIRGLKAGGSWALDDDIWMLVAENATQALTSLKQRRLAAYVAPTTAPVFGVDQGVTFNGTDNAINTGFIPNTHKVAMAQDNVRIAGYFRNNIITTNYALGAVTGTSPRIRLRPQGTGVAAADVNANGGTWTIVGDSRGYTSASRSTGDVSTYFAFKNSAQLTRTADPTSFSTTGLPTAALYIGCQNNAGTPMNFTAYQTGLVTIGAALSVAQELAEYNAIQAHMTAVGAQV